MRPSLVPTLALAGLAACGGGEPERAAGTVFEWVSVPGMTCADGSETGIGISRGSEDVLVVLNGGGACWGELTCNADPGPFGASEFAFAELFVPTSILDRQLPANPFSTWTLVFVPYCTGDVHAGDTVKDYASSGIWRHHGRKNLELALGVIAGAIPQPRRVVIAGSSAGGFGALLAYDLVRSEWPESSSTSASLIDDSGPTFVGTAIPDALRSAWWGAWGLSSTVTPVCAECSGNLAAIWPRLSAAHPGDRFALLSSTADATMRAFFGGMTGFEYEEALRELTLQLNALPNARVFRISGTAHPLLLRPALYSIQGTSLLDWLTPIASGTGLFESTGP